MMTHAYRYYVLEAHHGAVGREFINVGVLVVGFHPNDLPQVQFVEATDAQGKRLIALGCEALLLAVEGWADQFLTLTPEEIETFRKRSYMSSLLLSAPLGSVGDSCGEVLERLFPMFCEPSG